jgi:multidrug efflux system outer membrane protein
MMQMNSIIDSFTPKFARNVLARAIICGMILVLPSCAIPRLRQPETSPCLPEAYTAATNTENAAQSEANQSENSAQLGIDEFFNDPVLTQLVEQALAGNRELKILNEEIQIAKNEVLARRGAIFPLFSFGVGGGWEKTSLYTRNGAVDSQLNILPGQPFPNPLGNVAGGINASWQLDIWRQLRNARDAAAERYVAATERRNFFVTRLVAEIGENYYRLMALDKRIENLDKTIDLQEASRKIAVAKLEAGRGTELAVQRFQAEVRKNQSEKLIVKQDIVEAENRINFLLNRLPQPVERNSAEFFDLRLHALSIGIPSQLLQNRPDIRQAERELAAAGLDVKVARARFFPTLIITGSVGYEAFNPRYLFNPEAFAANVAGSLVAPLINKAAIKADYMSANARQLQAVYNYQRVVINAYTEVVNRVSMADNTTKSIEIKKQQLKALEASVEVASNLFQNARAEYVEVLLAQRDLMEAKMVLIETKNRQLAAIVNAYQALGGGNLLADSVLEETPADYWWWSRPFAWLHR